MKLLNIELKNLFRLLMLYPILNIEMSRRNEFSCCILPINISHEKLKKYNNSLLTDAHHVCLYCEKE